MSVKAKVVSLILPMLIEQAVKAVEPAQAKEFIDGLLDKLEDQILGNDNKYDDLAIPLISLLREIIGVPDND